MDSVVFASRSIARLELTVSGTHSSGDVVFAEWRARLTSRWLDASVDCSEEGWTQPLAEFLEGLAQDWRGWDGERAWVSGDGELRLTARHEKANTVLVAVEMADTSLGWRCESELELDPGVFLQLAADARRLAARSTERGH